MAEEHGTNGDASTMPHKPFIPIGNHGVFHQYCRFFVHLKRYCEPTLGTLDKGHTELANPVTLRYEWLDP